MKRSNNKKIKVSINISSNHHRHHHPHLCMFRKACNVEVLLRILHHVVQLRQVLFVMTIMTMTMMTIQGSHLFLKFLNDDHDHENVDNNDNDNNNHSEFREGRKKRFYLDQLTQTCESTHPLKKRYLGQERWLLPTVNYRQKEVKYAIKTVIYKSLGLPDPTHPQLGKISNIPSSFFSFSFFLGGAPLLYNLIHCKVGVHYYP